MIIAKEDGWFSSQFVCREQFNLCFFFVLLILCRRIIALSLKKKKNRFWTASRLPTSIPRAWTACVAGRQMHLSPCRRHSSSSLRFIFLTVANLPRNMRTPFSGPSRLRALKTAAPSIHTYPRTSSAPFFGGRGYLLKWRKEEKGARRSVR